MESIKEVIKYVIKPASWVFEKISQAINRGRAQRYRKIEFKRNKIAGITEIKLTTWSDKL